jgi:DNA-binding NarL/FixJ family response regulator
MRADARRGALAGVVIADDDSQVRSALTALLDGYEGLEVVGVADSGPGAADLCARLRPSLAVVDVMMPGGGEAAITAILLASAETLVAVYTARADRRTRERMLSAGATAVFAKGGPLDLAHELRALVTGGAPG